MQSTLGKISADIILKYLFSYFSQKTGFDEKNVVNLSSAELAQRVVKVKMSVYHSLRVYTVTYATLRINP